MITAWMLVIFFKGGVIQFPMESQQRCELVRLELLSRVPAGSADMKCMHAPQ